MANKSFNIFLGDNPVPVNDGDKLVIELGKSHTAFMHINGENNGVVGFELFSFAESESNSSEKFFAGIADDSRLVRSNYATVDIFLNNEYCVTVPEEKFNESIAEDYLQVVFGRADLGKLKFTKIESKSSLINIFMVPDILTNELKNRFHQFKVHHSWSNILKLQDNKDYSGIDNLMYVQFYNTYFIASVFLQGKLHLFQTFIYDNPDDVLYQILNITNQLNLDKSELLLEVSGLIDPNYKLFRELNNYFKNIVSGKSSSANVLINVDEFPRHYFSPFFNLSV